MSLQKNLLGRTGIEVTGLCLGALPMGPLQKGLPLTEATAVVARALERGINFIDTAQVYGTYAPIREAIKATGLRPVVATKSAAETYAEMEAAVREALAELALDQIDLFHLHAARVGTEVFAERAGALRCLHDFKNRGVIKAVGISTHDVRTTEAAAARDDIDVVFPIFNQAGRGILNGTVPGMARAITRNYEAGKGVYLMKVLGGGTLLDSFAENLDFARRAVPSHAIAIGMVHPAEVDYNVDFFAGRTDLGPPPSIIGHGKQVKVSANLCRGCGACLDACHSDALAVFADKARVDADKCVRCGYCTVACPQFAIRVV
ncbi:MAG: aldo/keto reductase [Bacteroidota bacterium]